MGLILSILTSSQIGSGAYEGIFDEAVAGSSLTGNITISSANAPIVVSPAVGMSATNPGC